MEDEQVAVVQKEGGGQEVWVVIEQWVQIRDTDLPQLTDVASNMMIVHDLNLAVYNIVNLSIICADMECVGV